MVNRYRVTIPEHHVEWRGVGIGPDDLRPVRRTFMVRAYDEVHYADTPEEALKLGVHYAWLDGPVHPFRSLTRQTAAMAHVAPLGAAEDDRRRWAGM